MPPMLQAAMPVEAVTAVVADGRRRISSRSSTDLPLPAGPVKNKDAPPFTARITLRGAGVRAIGALGAGGLLRLAPARERCAAGAAVEGDEKHSNVGDSVCLGAARFGRGAPNTRQARHASS